MPFADDFRRLVGPRLSRECRVRALFVYLECETWVEAYYGVLHLANKFGATRLPPDRLARLEEWAASTLLKHIDVYEHRHVNDRDISNRVAADLTRWHATIS